MVVSLRSKKSSNKDHNCNFFEKEPKKKKLENTVVERRDNRDNNGRQFRICIFSSRDRQFAYHLMKV